MIRRAVVLAIFNVATVVLWFGVPTVLVFSSAGAHQTAPDDGDTARVTSWILVAMGFVSVALIAATVLLLRRRRASDTIINIVVQMLLLSVLPLVFVSPAISIFALVPAPALLASIWRLTRPPPRPFSM